MTTHNSSRPIARVFRATAASGCRDERLRRFHSSSAALVNSKAGCLGYQIFEPVDAVGARSCVRVPLAGPQRGQGGVWRRMAGIISAGGLRRFDDGLFGGRQGGIFHILTDMRLSSRGTDRQRNHWLLPAG